MKRIIKYAFMLIVLFSVGTTFQGCSKDDDDEPEVVDPTTKADVDDTRIFGTWEGDFFGDTFILTFSEDGKMKEKVGNDEGVFSYSLKKGKLTISPSTSALNNIMGNDIEVSFSGNNKMTIKCNLWDMEMKKR